MSPQATTDKSHRLHSLNTFSFSLLNFRMNKKILYLTTFCYLFKPIAYSFRNKTIRHLGTDDLRKEIFIH